VFSVVLQNFVDLQKCVPVSSRQACLLSPHDDNHFVNVRVEEVSGTAEEEDPLLITSPQRKANEEEVSFLDVGFLHPVACVRLDDAGFNPSTQRQYRRLIFSAFTATCFGCTTIFR
jgi:hypothetical protein